MVFYKCGTICYFYIFYFYSYISSSIRSFVEADASRVCLVLGLNASLLMHLLLVCRLACLCVVSWPTSYYFPWSSLEDLGYRLAIFVVPSGYSTVPCLAFVPVFIVCAGVVRTFSVVTTVWLPVVYVDKPAFEVGVVVGVVLRFKLAFNYIFASFNFPLGCCNCLYNALSLLGLIMLRWHYRCGGALHVFWASSKKRVQSV